MYPLGVLDAVYQQKTCSVVNNGAKMAQLCDGMDVWPVTWWAYWWNTPLCWNGEAAKLALWFLLHY
jgi:hypothetical protein